MTAVLEPQASAAPALVSIAVADLHASPANPRADVGDVTELAASIAAVGLLEPLVVRPNAAGYEVVCGARRLAAAVHAGLVEVACTVRDLDDRQMLEAALTENLQRVDLSVLEEAAAYQGLVDLGYSQRDLAKRVAKSQPHISRRLSLLKLPPKARAAVDAGSISVEQATTLSRVPADEVEKLFKRGAPSSYDVQHAIRTQENADRREAARKELVAKGVTVLDNLPGERWECVLRSWGSLSSIDVEAHASELCHAAVVEHHGDILFVCTEPERHAPGGASALTTQEDVDDDDDEPEAVPDDETPEEQAARAVSRAAADALRAARDESRARRLAAIEARRAFVARALADIDAAGAVDLTALLFTYCDYFQDPFDQRTADLLGIEADTYGGTSPDEQIKAYMAKGSRNRARAVAAAAASMLEAMVTPGMYSLAVDRCSLAHDEDEAAGRAWFAWLVGRGYQLSDHDRELIPESEAPTETEPPPGSITPPVETITVKKARKRFKVSCSVCGDVGHNTTEQFATERGALHLKDEHGHVAQASALDLVERMCAVGAEVSA